MRAMCVHETGRGMRLEDIPDPAPGPGEVLVAIHACGVNFADTLMVEGRYQEKPPLPFTPGMEICGTIRALGPGVAGPAPGTRVAAFTGSGGFAQLATIPVERCVPVPPSMTDAQAAGFLVAYGTSHLALSHRARLQPGETLLVLGAAGGVGLTAVELGALMGARVIACARGREKLAVARAAGAHHLIDSDTADLRAEVKALGGADVCYDPVGGAPFDAALRAMRPEGRILPVGFASGAVPQIPANILLVKNLTVIGFYWGAYASLRPDLMAESLRQLFAWHEAGRLHPHVSHVLPLTQAQEALDLLRLRAATGKVVVQIRDASGSTL
ncbi:NADPH:quinone oxidoreductase family protein [Halovulum dunhuangense]|uniref:NADPH:quinone oxidoreductase family protein n=1 Tax=Halovulum dunhuangense TaxID=1505036 RepID=A0A849L5F3_9RHOB|nr:NADPH:quinone oxidoreductase family protein [Halovulum dunhuangense]NNU81404.1 NADPH:quinone oxidoreductase family protein [Halovulum dunhuangense]